MEGIRQKSMEWKGTLAKMDQIKKEMLSNEEKRFLALANAPNRKDLLERLEKLELLAAFLAAENGTTE